MKNLIITFSVALLLVATSACQKTLEACKNYEEIKTNSNHLVDINSINAPELLDTLNKYPQLQLATFERYPSGNWGAECNMFYKGLPVYSYSNPRRLYRSHFSFGYVVDTTFLHVFPDISITPSVSIEDAVKAAKYSINFDHTCIQYELVVYLKSSYYSQIEKRYIKQYVLAWKIRDKNNKDMFVFIDAQTKGLIYCTCWYSGIIYE